MSVRELSFLLTDVKRLLRREYLKSDLPITPMQARALVYVSRFEGLRQKALADILEIQPITTARLIDQLSDEGLVERRPDPTDRRAHCLYLTDQAQALLDDIGVVVEDVNRKAVAGLSADEIDQLLHLLKVMHSNLSQD
ncbi:MarR family winged helix-turn-helix transcriptional regulator [Marinomonas communis]|uniref:DNA-binding MarR family transcriptional regulator n=1 Tax=Marinomonas communis TaxID=28254 RepID=A0A4R6XAH7_9GAMM|nr:MarR family transcriptional regulator [Marinomonas communis]MCC4273530.1 MarR family transcriptional regulator [Marinomonas communis]MEC8081613.1 MarR family transcriptional regulator [Pseudomonadota bacterium]MEC8482836.1 MarR family transcriptional regulator [Pseudomonadota bacterium]TDR13883.1 DNA-binding MarR family transcriptional regulator [Marinomonas communis]